MLDNMFSSVNLLEKGLSASWLRNKVINNNIANADTPGFKTSHVEFEDIIANSLKDNVDTGLDVTGGQHLKGGNADLADLKAEVVRDSSTAESADNNNVSVEHEMTELAKNSIEYYTLVSKVNSEFRKLNTAIDLKS